MYRLEFVDTCTPKAHTTGCETNCIFTLFFVESEAHVLTHTKSVHLSASSERLPRFSSDKFILFSHQLNKFVY